MYGKVAVIIPTFDGLDILKKNLPSVISSFKNSENSIFEVIIVDDGSKDGTAAFLKSNFPEVRTIKHSKNRGFSASVNTGVRMSKCEYVVLLNNDVEVEKDFLVSAISNFQDDTVFGVSFHEKGYGPSYGKFEKGYIVHKAQKESKTTHKTFWVNGGSCMLRRKAFLDLGGFDEEIFKPFYWEDIDLNYRAQKRGYKIYWEPNSKVIHNHETTIGRFNKIYKERIWERNQLLFIWKNLTSANLFRKHILGLMARVIKHPGYMRIILMALPKYRIILKRRKKEFREGKISDEAIFSSFS